MTPNVPIPETMLHLKRDKRGYPIPYIVLVAPKSMDKNGEKAISALTATGLINEKVVRKAVSRGPAVPHFTVNDAKQVKRCILHNRCGICGNKMGELIWFVGGPGAALHPNGAYIDPPMHEECVKYALQVCPFLAVRKYEGAKATYVYEDEGVVLGDTGVMKGKPSMFVLKSSHGFVNMGTLFEPRMVPTDTVTLEFWKDGKRLDDDDPFVDEAIQSSLGVIDKMEAEQNSAQHRSPMMGSMASYAPIKRR